MTRCNQEKQKFGKNPRRIVFFLAVCPPRGLCLNHKHNVLKGRVEEESVGEEDVDINRGQSVRPCAWCSSALEALKSQDRKGCGWTYFEVGIACCRDREL